MVVWEDGPSGGRRTSKDRRTMESGELRRASMPVITGGCVRPPPDGEEAGDALDASAYDAEIKNLQKTLKDLGIGRPSEGCGPDVRPKQRADYKTSAANRQSRSRSKTVDHSEDYVPDYLVSPYMRPKAKGHLRVKDDVEDTGIVSPRMGGSRRRQSDPGRLSGAALSSLQARYSGVSSDSSEDEEVASELRSPRARSPRRVFSSVPEDEAYPASVSPQAPGRGSPRRRLLQSRHAQSLCHPEESPRRMRRNRSNSLPLPDRTALGIGEAVGALVHLGADPGQHRQQMLKRSRCISIEESPLEAILEEAGGQRAIRRFSVPANIANAATRRLQLPKEC